MFGKNTKKEDRGEDSNRPFNEKEMARMHEITDAVGLAKSDGFIIAARVVSTEVDETHETIEVDGISKVANCNRMTILKTVFKALDMDTEDVIEYVMRQSVDKGSIEEVE